MVLILQIVTLGILASANAVALAPVSVMFHDSATVNDTVIRLGDIATVCSAMPNAEFESLRNAVVGEAAPAGYCRKVNTDDVVTFVLNKNYTGFTFAKARKKAITVSTACQEKKVGEFRDLIEKYLGDSVKWLPEDYSVSVRNTDEKWKCLKGPIDVSVSGLLTKYPKGNVNLKLAARQNSKIYSIPVVCCVTVVTPVVTAKTTIPRGTLLTSGNCAVERKDITNFAGYPFSSLSQLNEVIANRTIGPETILQEKLTTHMPIIGKDEQVYVIIDRGVVRVSIIMRAREQGALGDKIWVENELTHKLLKTKIIGKGKVELLEGVKTI
jgi:flagella basal body P-ring formation protein FlgA